MTTITLQAADHRIASAGKIGRVGVTSPPRPAPVPSTAFERLIHLTHSNDRLVEELAVARRRLVQALAYAGDPRSRPDLGEALVGLARKRHARVLEALRANRSSALSILASLPDVR